MPGAHMRPPLVVRSVVPGGRPSALARPVPDPTATQSAALGQLSAPIVSPVGKLPALQCAPASSVRKNQVRKSGPDKPGRRDADDSRRHPPGGGTTRTML